MYPGFVGGEFEALLVPDLGMIDVPLIPANGDVFADFTYLPRYKRRQTIQSHE